MRYILAVTLIIVAVSACWADTTDSVGAISPRWDKVGVANTIVDRLSWRWYGNWAQGTGWAEVNSVTPTKAGFVVRLSDFTAREVLLHPNGRVMVVLRGDVLHGIYRADQFSIEFCFNPFGGAAPNSFGDPNSTTWMFKRRVD